MKALLLAAATLVVVGCHTEPAAVRVQHRTSAEPEAPGASGSAGPTAPLHPLLPADEHEATTTTATTVVAVTPTATTEPPVSLAPRRAATTVAPARGTTTVYEVPSPQGRTTRAIGEPPPEYVKQCESGGDYGAVNPNGHYGAWQFSMATWASVGGTGRPDHATPAEQDKRAAILWAGGAGASHWACA